VRAPDNYANDLELWPEVETIDSAQEPEPFDALNAAAGYARLGLRVFPVVMIPVRGVRAKEPPSGYLWKARASNLVSEVVQDFEEAAHRYGAANLGVAWACGIDGYVAVDLDREAPDFWPELTAVPHARNETAKGEHLIWPFPDGLIPSNSTNHFPSRGWGEVRGVGGYIVIAAPDRPGFDASGLGTLPRFPRPDWLSTTDDNTAAASSADVADFIAAHTEDRFAMAIKGPRRQLDAWRPGGDAGNGRTFPAARHEMALEVACWLARESAAGHYPAAGAFQMLRNWWCDVMDTPTDRHRQTNRELPSIISWAVGQALSDPQRIADTRSHAGLSLAPARVTASTDEVLDDLLGDEFWSARPFLEHIRQAARSRRVAPTAVLGSVLARAAAWTPPNRCIPPFVGGTQPLSLIVALIGGTSDGKSAPERVASDLMPTRPAGALGPLGLGSGEGAIDAFIERYQAEDPDTGKRVTRQRQGAFGALFILDEGEALAEMASRKGQTLIPTLRTMWSGSALGQQNASAETIRNLGAGDYAVGIVSLWQPTRMGGLFADIDGGLPGRFLFLALGDSSAPDTPPEWPGALEWNPPKWVQIAGAAHTRPLEYPESVAAEVDAERLARLRQEHTPAPLDGHRTLHRLKVAGTLAQLDGNRDYVDLCDWHLAGQLLEHSDRTRANVLGVLATEDAKREDAAVARTIRREGATERAVDQRALDRAAKAVANRTHRGGTARTGDLRRAIAGRDRQHVTVEDAVAEAHRLRWLEPDGDGVWKAGEAKPA
jgi:hypothetical protein